MLSIPIVSILIFLPIIALLVIITINNDNESSSLSIRYIAIFTSFIHLIFSLYLGFVFDRGVIGYVFVENLPIVDLINFSYNVGLDGISMLFVIMTSFVFFMIFCFIDFPSHNQKFYAICMLLIFAGAVGTFAAIDLILFFSFYEVAVLPVFFLIGFFGENNKYYASFKFLLYTIFSSLFMLIAIVIMIIYSGSSSLETFENFAFNYNTQLVLFWLFIIAFAVKSAIFPLHTWLPDTYLGSPNSLNIVLSAVLMKFGIYGLIRIVVPVFPIAIIRFVDIIYIIAFVNMVYAFFIAFKINNLKQLFAYFSMAHVALMFAGVFAINIQSIEGVVFQALLHSLLALSLFLILEYMRKRFYNLDIKYFSGLANKMPMFAFCIFVIMLSAIGLPLTGGFIGEFLLLFGIFQDNRIFAALFAFTLLFGAVVVMRFYRKVLFGKVNDYTKYFYEINWFEKLALTVLVILLLLTGVYPNVMLDFLHVPVAGLIDHFKDGIIVGGNI